jgi:hypothetical protein
MEALANGGMITPETNKTNDGSLEKQTFHQVRS